jgi:hypothetical protein
MIVDYTGPIGGDLETLVREHLQSGRMMSSSKSSTLGLGYGDNAFLGKSTFAGQNVDSSSILIKFTLFGDANLDAGVDVTDLGALATDWQTSAPWRSGDFGDTYDGFVDVTDLGALATNWQHFLMEGGMEEGRPEVGLPGSDGSDLGNDQQSEFLDIVSELGLSDEQVSNLLSILGSGGV